MHSIVCHVETRVGCFIPSAHKCSLTFIAQRLLRITVRTLVVNKLPWQQGAITTLRFIELLTANLDNATVTVIQ